MTVRLEGHRIEARDSNVTRGGGISSAALEQQLDKFAVSMQETRRDVDNLVPDVTEAVDAQIGRITEQGDAQVARLDSATDAAIVGVNVARDAGVETVNDTRDAAVETVNGTLSAVLASITSTVDAGLLSLSTSISTGIVNIGNAVTAGLGTLTAYVNTAVAQMAGYLATAAALAGIIGTYDTKAEANAALAAFPANGYALVLVDESQNGYRFVYRKVGGVWSPRGYVPGVRDLYVSNVASPDGTYRGADPNDGLTPATPKRSLGAIRAIASAGCNIWQERGSVWYPEANIVDWQALPNVNLKSYGQGPKPEWTCRISLADKLWVLVDNVTYPGLYKTTKVFDPYFYNPGNVSIYSSSTAIWQPAMYNESTGRRYLKDCGVKQCFTGVDRPACLASVVATANAGQDAFYCNITGDNAHINPIAIGVTGSSVDYYLKLADGSDPNGKNITVVDQRHVAIMMEGCNINEGGLVMQATGSKDMILFRNYFQNMTPGLWEDIEIRESAIHGIVSTGVCTRNAILEPAYHGGSYNGGGGALHDYRGTSQQGRARGVEHVNVTIGAYAIGHYLHGSGVNAGFAPNENEGLKVWGGSYTGCGSIVNQVVNRRGFICYNIRAYNVDQVASVCGGGAEPNGGGYGQFYNSRIFIKPGLVGTSYLFEDIGVAPKVRLVNSLIYNPNNNSVFAGSNTGTLGQPLTYPTLELINSIMTSGPAGYNYNASAKRAAFHLTLTGTNGRGSYWGTYGLANGQTPWITGTVTADANSVIETSMQSVEDLQAVHPGINSAVLTGVHRQKFQKTILATDFVYPARIHPAYTVSYSGVPKTGSAGAPGSTADLDGTLTVTTLISRQIKVFDTDGTTVLYVGRVTNKNSGTNKIEVSPAPAAAFSAGKVPWNGYFNHDLFSTEMSATAAIDDTGLSAKLNVAGLGAMFTPGMLVRVGNIPGQPWQAPLIRKISAVDNVHNAITFSAAVPWANFQPGATWNKADDSVTAFLPTPSVSLSFGFPAWGPQSLNVGKAFYNVTFAEGGSTGNLYAGNSTTRFPGFTSATVNMIGSISSAGLATGNYGLPFGLNFNTGEIKVGFAVGQDDILNVQMNIDVREYRMAGNLAVDPARAGDILFIPGSEYANRLGYYSTDRGGH